MVQMKKWNNTHPIMESQNRYFRGSNYSQNNRSRGSNSIKRNQKNLEQIHKNSETENK